MKKVIIYSYSDNEFDVLFIHMLFYKMSDRIITRKRHLAGIPPGIHFPKLWLLDCHSGNTSNASEIIILTLPTFTTWQK